MSKVYAISDLHGRIPHIPECDLLLLGGDICPDHPIGKRERYSLHDNGAAWQANWLADVFRHWLASIRERGTEVVAIWGNHDFVGEHPQLVPPLDWVLLQDELHTTEEGFEIYGTPWVPGLPRWAFYKDERALRLRAEAIPEKVDVLLSHGPPYGWTDFTVPRYGSLHVGDGPLNMALHNKKPLTLVCGHIHEGRGIMDHPSGTRIYNVAHMDEVYDEQRGGMWIEELS
jgi:Icc-related predicted phosphoesterase